MERRKKYLREFWGEWKGEGEGEESQSRDWETIRALKTRLREFEKPTKIFGGFKKSEFVEKVKSSLKAMCKEPQESKYIIEDGNNIYDFTYVENVAHAHICAERALASEGMVAEKAAGQEFKRTLMRERGRF
ncbi:Digalactosyldiacylglycerol synthase 1, chloroplastic [Morella rubra]|uniref:Digalactosyldiacylglycerol synthase 1, chloroplastic n=1 Tax=Morella rubra TaxID=262757 RepID=A0A6A1UQD8_9ROSI|nr:Digalactosyldiacylglycerol synthase 1, chloroplastic [Morella rubra]